ncbi:MAG TPA: hypothetical protein VF395_03640 [Polyangiaceae bacterium]
MASGVVVILNGTMPPADLLRNATRAYGGELDSKDLVSIGGTRRAGTFEFAAELERVMRVAVQKALRYVSAKGRFLRAEDWDDCVDF